MDNKDECKITISKDGPYIVTGNVPLSEKVITPLCDGTYEYREGRELPQSETYALCRCGKSKTPPFCDGSHVECGFDGTETAANNKFSERVELKMTGPEVDLLDDGRCALARLCHRKNGDMWTIIRSTDPFDMKDVIEGARECPAGRLVVKDKDGNTIEEDFEPAIEVLQDPERRVSGPLYVKGHITLESSNGYTYEKRNRLTLCRCGNSKNMPYCDFKHVTTYFEDE